MAINRFNIIKWVKMLSGSSLDHVNQPVGKAYSIREVKGYYNDLTLKVLRGNGDLIPTSKVEDGRTLYVATEVFQYGLAAYDLYLKEKDIKYKNMFEACVNWACENQEETGAWNNFHYIFPTNPYSSMTQGEGSSLLVRAYCEYNDEMYLDKAYKAITFMVTEKEKGGTALINGDSIVLLEYTHLAPVLNGWIFSIFGLVDYLKIKKDLYLQEILNHTLTTLVKELPKFDNGFWSLYDNEHTIASPFYHDLHIALLTVMSELFQNDEFLSNANRFAAYKKKKINYLRAFLMKAYQKIVE